MATERINLHFGSTYSGEGFKAVNKEVRTTADAVKKSSEGMMQFGQILGGVDSTVGKVASGIFNLSEAITAGGGPIAIFATAAIGVVTALVKWKQASDEAAAAHKKMMADMMEGYNARIAMDIEAIAAKEQAGLDAIVASAAEAVKEVTNLANAFKSLGSAEDSSMAAGLNLAIAKINDEFSAKLNEASAELQPLVQAERELAIALERQRATREIQQRAVERETAALQDVEEKIAAQKSLIDAQVAAGQDATAARKALTAMEIERAAAAARLKTAEMTAETANLQCATAVKNCQAAVERTSKSWDSAVAANEAANEAVEEAVALGKIHDEITRICMKNEVTAAEYIKLYGDSIAEGLTHTEAYGKLQEKLNKELEKRTEAEKKAADGTGSGCSGGKAGQGGTKGKPLYVSLSTSISDEIGKTGGKTWSETQREARKHHAEMMKDALPLYRAMKGQMPKEQQKLFENYLMSKYTPEQVKEIWDVAQSKQLIDKEERKKQTRYLNAMVEAMKKQGLG